MYLEQLSLRAFRNYLEAELAPAPQGITLVLGDNGAGKTNLLEAVYYAGNLRSFRSAPAEALVHEGHEQAVVRASCNRDGRSLLVEIELKRHGRHRLRLNRQAVRRSEDLVNTVLVTVFSPDDIEIVKGAPQVRRDFLDDLAAQLSPKFGAARTELERVLRQRNALLRSAGGTLRAGMDATLDVWDTKLAAVGEQIAEVRRATVDALGPEASTAYRALAAGAERARPAPGRPDDITVAYDQSWQGDLLAVLKRARQEDVRRGATSAGPQRDDVGLAIGHLAARAQASQGEQRSLALALRLAGHRLVEARQGSSPVLLLDDIFSELDPKRSAALANCLPAGQALLSAAGPVRPELPIAASFLVRAGTVQPA